MSRRPRYTDSATIMAMVHKLIAVPEAHALEAFAAIDTRVRWYEGRKKSVPERLVKARGYFAAILLQHRSARR